jgi:hypothetical protein
MTTRGGIKRSEWGWMATRAARAAGHPLMVPRLLERALARLGALRSGSDPDLQEVVHAR